MAGRAGPGMLMAMPWQLSALIALVAFSASYLAFRGAGAVGAGAAAMLLPVLAIGAVLTVVQASVTGASLNMPGRAWLLIGGAALACYVGNLAQLDAVTRAPNPGAALAIVNASVVVVALAAWPLFGTPISAGKGLGVGLCMLGIILVGILP